MVSNLPSTLLKSASKSIHSHAKKLQEAFSHGASSSDSHNPSHRKHRLFNKQSSTNSDLSFSESGEEKSHSHHTASHSNHGLKSAIKSKLSFGGSVEENRVIKPKLSFGSVEEQQSGKPSSRRKVLYQQASYESLASVEEQQPVKSNSIRKIFHKQASYGSASSGNGDTSNVTSGNDQSDSSTRQKRNGGRNAPSSPVAGPKEALQGEVRLNHDVRRMMSAISSGASVDSWDSLPPILSEDNEMDNLDIKDGVVPSSDELRMSGHAPNSAATPPRKAKKSKRRKMKPGADASCNDSCIVQ